ncbi:hypothetical protein D3C75_547670 [compost metagenome]
MLMVGNTQSIAYFLRIILFLAEAKMVPVYHQHTVIPQSRLFQPADEGSKGIVGIIDCCKIIP